MSEEKKEETPAKETKETTRVEYCCGPDSATLFVGVAIGLWTAAVIWACVQD